MRIRDGDFHRWLALLCQGDQADLEQAREDERLRLEYLEDYLRDEHSVTVRADGLIEFETLNPKVAGLIGDLPVLVFHHTSDAILPQVRRDGLVAGRNDVNRWGKVAAGVYLTTQTSGPAVKSYHQRARIVHGGEPVTLGVRATLDELCADPDDADIGSGRRQFLMPHVAPERIVERPDMAIPPFLFHATTTGRLEGIAQNGLVRDAPRFIGSPALDGHAAGRTFFSQERGTSFWHQRAQMFAEHSSDDHLKEGAIPVILRIKTAGLSFEEDPEGSRDSGEACFLTADAVPSEAIELWNGHEWVGIEDWPSLNPRRGIDRDGDLLQHSPLLPPDDLLDLEKDEVAPDTPAPTPGSIRLYYGETYQPSEFAPEARKREHLEDLWFSTSPGVAMKANQELGANDGHISFVDLPEEQVRQYEAGGMDGQCLLPLEIADHRQSWHGEQNRPRRKARGLAPCI